MLTERRHLPSGKLRLLQVGCEMEIISPPPSVKTCSVLSSGAVSKSGWPSWAYVFNKPTVPVDVKQHFNAVPQSSGAV